MNLGGLDLVIDSPRRKSKLRGVLVILILAGGAIALGGWGVYSFFFKGKEQAAVITGTVTRGALSITVTERGDLESSKTESIRCEVEGRQIKIIEIVPEGVVKKDQVIVRFDAEELTRQHREQEIKVKTAEGKARANREELEVQKNKAASEVAKAQLDLTLADIARDKYLQKEYQVEEDGQKGAIALSERDLQEAQEKLENYRKFVKQGFGTPEQLRLKEAELERTKFYLSRDKAKLELLQQFTRKEQEVKLTATAAEAKRNVERVKSSSNASVAKAQSELDAAEITTRLEQSALDRLKKQLEKCEVRAPQDGMLVYSKLRYYGDPSMGIRAGGMVFFQQVLCQLPDLTKMQAKLRVHESVVKKVKPGQKAELRLDAFPSLLLRGTVEKVATLAHSDGYYDERGVKEYETVVKIDDFPADAGILPGMTGEVKIFVNQLANVLVTPVQAVTEKEGQHYCYVIGPDGAERRAVIVGENNEKFVEIKSGLNEDEKVALDARARLALETKKEEAEKGDQPGAKPKDKEKPGDKPKADALQEAKPAAKPVVPVAQPVAQPVAAPAPK